MGRREDKSMEKVEVRGARAGKRRDQGERAEKRGTYLAKLNGGLRVSWQIAEMSFT